MKVVLLFSSFLVRTGGYILKKHEYTELDSKYPSQPFSEKLNICHKLKFSRL